MNPAHRSVRVFDDLESLSREAATYFVDTALSAISLRGRCLIALSGGNTPMRLYENLANEEYREQLDWNDVHFFWGDERCVPVGDAGNSYGQARKIFLDKLKVSEENVHRVQSELEPVEAAKDYARILNDFAEPGLHWPRFDLVLLGMGDDGHTASLFPDSPVDVTSPTLAVTAQYQGRPANRVTLTQLVFNSAYEIAFLVSGTSKAGTLAIVLEGNYQPGKYPAQRINPDDGNVTWFVDKAAATKLKHYQP